MLLNQIINFSFSCTFLGTAAQKMSDLVLMNLTEDLPVANKILKLMRVSGQSLNPLLSMRERFKQLVKLSL